MIFEQCQSINRDHRPMSVTYLSGLISTSASHALPRGEEISIWMRLDQPDAFSRSMLKEP